VYFLAIFRLGGVVVGTLFGLAAFGRRFNSQPWHCLVISEIGDRISRVNYLVIQPGARSTQPCIPLGSGSQYRVPASSGSGSKGGKVSVGWQDAIWYGMWLWFPIALWWLRLRIAISIANCLLYITYLLTWSFPGAIRVNYCVTAM